MQYLPLSLPDLAANIALDEALLEHAEVAGSPKEVLRIWTSPAPIVVIGRASKVAVEVNLNACRRAGVPVIRRCSGGCAVVAGPGCLMYSLVISLQNYPQAAAVDGLNQLVLSRIMAAINGLRPGVTMQGSSDLTLDGRKFSGNSIRIRRTHVLYHGTLLHDFDLPQVSTLLGTPPREPGYRAGRGHDDFIANLKIDPGKLTAAIVDQWQPLETADDWPEEETLQLTREKYSRDDWNLRL